MIINNNEVCEGTDHMNHFTIIINCDSAKLVKNKFQTQLNKSCYNQNRPKKNFIGCRRAVLHPDSPHSENTSPPSLCLQLLDWQPSGIQESSCRLEDSDEPTAVSQYFLGDIFTEVESE